MTVTEQPLFVLEGTFARDLEGLYIPWQAAAAPEPELLVLNQELAEELGLDPKALHSPEGVAVFAGNAVPAGSTPIAQAYAGHQFGGYSPRLGDGRALLLGELVDADGRRRDLHLKGSGRTPFARGADGRAAVGPMLREFVIGEAMDALGIPTSRALAVVATGEEIAREVPLPGAVLARVAASHLRVGTFEFAARAEDPELVRRLADYAIARHYPEAAEAENPYLAFLEAVIEAQSSLIASWMLVGFIHGVMNTDNMAISGESIDYGPCAFMDAYDPKTVFSSIDVGGRYAYGNQPAIAHWNLMRFAETLLRLLGPDQEAAIASATAVLETFPDRYRGHWSRGMGAKLGLADVRPEHEELFDDLLELMHAQGADFTSSFRALSASLRGDDEPMRALLADPASFDAWRDRWRTRVSEDGGDLETVAAAMDRVNPLYVPRNHKVEEALDAATGGDLEPFRELCEVLADPSEERPGLETYAAPAPAALSADYRTFCGT